MNAKETLLRMLKIQELALEARDAEDVIEKGPARIEEIEGRFRERNTEYVALKDRYDELDADQRERTGELTELEESKKKYMNDLMQVTNQREYSAMLKEIDVVKARISEHEDVILKDMEEMESLKGELETFSAHIQQERVEVKKEHAQVDSEMQEARERREQCRRERKSIEAELPRDLLVTLRRIEENRQGLFLVKVEEGLCQACFVRVRPQVFQEIKLASKLHMCGNCKRYLYHEPALRPEVSEGPRDGDASGAEVVDGGAL